MEELKKILLDELKARPAMELQDAVKLLYQSEFGGGHLITDPEGALARLREEMASCRATDDPLIQPIGGGMVRINLWPASGRISAETLFRLFLLSSNAPRGTEEGFIRKLSLLCEVGYDRAQVERWIEAARETGCAPFSHSDAYRAAYRPAYRVVTWEYARWFDVYSAVDRLSRFAGPIIIGIDGMCASGKTTLGSALAEVFEGSLFHTDDYYLPPEKRTRRRMDEPGGNMDRERLLEEVLVPLSRRQDTVTRAFDCGTMEFGEERKTAYRRVNIVEGSYSLHPELADFYTLKIATRTDPAAQLERLAARGPDMLGSFIARWIPLENSYFSATDLWSRADMTIDT